MIRNYISIAWRNVIRNKAFSLINILGLALGITCSLVIMLWVNDERNMDAFHENDANLFSVYERQYHDGIVNAAHNTPGLLAQEMKIKFPEIQYASSMAWNEVSAFEANEKILKQDGNYGSPDFFLMFSYPVIAGDPKTALSQPTNIAISRKMANDFFGSPEKALGKSIRYKNRTDLSVTLVFENIAPNSSKKFDFILPWEVFLEGNSWATDWGNNGPATYLSLHAGTNIEAFRSKIKDFIDLYSKQENFKIELDIQKYSDLYLHSNFKNGALEGGRIQYVILFTIVAGFILLIACINFMNLSTARSVKRAKEIGIRKVVGAIRGALIRQFIGESMLTIIISFSVAMLSIFFILPIFNEITQKQVQLPINSLWFWLGILSVTVFTGFVSGSYPALYLSSFQPARVLKGSLKFSAGSRWVRKGLVVFQFAMAVILIIGTIVVSRQVNYMQSVNLGYNRENLIYIPMEGDLAKKYSLFKDQALNMPGVLSVTNMTATPTSLTNGTGGVVWEGKDPSSRIQFTFAAIGFDFSRAMQLEFLQGRDFSRDFASDSAAYIVNEAALKILNYKDPIGMPLTFWEKKGTIVGVLKDFHFTSLHDRINPLVLRLGEDIGYGSILVRVDGSKTKEALINLEKILKELNPQVPFSYQFSDEEYQKLYKSEEIVGELSNVFAFLGIFISCLGLLGLAMSTAEQRTREVGIRKVLGASWGSLFQLLSKDLLVLVAIAMLLASPLAWYVMDNWLNAYAYRIEITAWTFISAGILVMSIALATISYQAMKAAFVNPVNSLRSE